MSIPNALQACTKDNAYVVGRENQVGTIEEGRMADVILLDADLLEYIRVLQGGRHVSMVIKDGEAVDLERSLANEDSLAFQSVAF